MFHHAWWLNLNSSWLKNQCLMVNFDFSWFNPHFAWVLCYSFAISIENFRPSCWETAHSWPSPWMRGIVVRNPRRKWWFHGNIHRIFLGKSSTMWGPSSIAFSWGSHNSNNYRYGIYNELVTGANLTNKHILGASHRINRGLNGKTI